MAFEMIDGDERLADRQGQPLADQKSDHYAADQPRTRGRRDRIDLTDGDIGLMQHLANQSRQDLDMGASGNFRNYAAKGAVRVVLPDHGLRQDLPIAANQRRGTVVARGFEGKNEGHRQWPLPETPALR